MSAADPFDFQIVFGSSDLHLEVVVVAMQPLVAVMGHNLMIPESKDEKQDHSHRRLPLLASWPIDQHHSRNFCDSDQVDC